MFNSDLTKNFNYQDVTFEILIMLLGAFLLGCVFCWIIKKLFVQKDKKHSESESIKTYLDSQNPNKQHSISDPHVKVIKSSSHSYNNPRIDDLTKISGIDSEIQTLLKTKGINSYIDLKDVNHQKLKDILSETNNKKTGLREVETWPHQASLAAKGEWTRLYDYQSFVQRARAASQKALKSKPSNADDLKKIEGIGPKIEEILNRNGIYTFKQLRETESDILKRYIVIEDVRFEKNETDSWPHQAGMAEKGQWEELSIYQEFMDISDDDENLTESDTRKITGVNSLQADDVNDGTYTNKEQSSTLTDFDIETSEEISSINKDYIKLIEEKQESAKDDLKKIDGIGPKIEEILNENGIKTYSKLHKMDRNTLKQYLENAGNQFKMHEPASWPHQAGMAARGEWNDLRLYQEYMDNGRATPASSSVKQLSSLHIKPADSSDDLKKIEGIGPKIENLLKNAGINTFERLKDSSRNEIKTILANGGPQYRMHEPETWPLQAAMAFNKEWDKLKEYQDFLLGGRE